MHNLSIQYLKNLYHLFQSILANFYYGFPSKKLKVIGVTGTDGKTTTTHLIYHILTSAGKKVSMVSSVYAKVGEKEFDTGFHVTTPDVFPLQKLLSESAKNKDEYFVLETTSHALYQNRVSGIQYEIGVLTNVTHEHLDMHHTLEEYTEIKLRLLRRAKYAVANEDDQSFVKIKNQISNIKNADQKSKLLTYGRKNFNILKDFNNLPDFNKYNYLAAFTACKVLGIDKQTILKAMRTFHLPKGRYEVISTKPVTAIIDFAHTPNGIQEILKEVKKKYIRNGNRLIHVFGAAAQRDKTKRPFMGEASGTYADLVILTEEDYRDEDPKKIASEIAEGLNRKGFKEVGKDDFGKKTKTFAVITDRKKAIDKAIAIARKNDIVIATGKGHEKSLCRRDKEYEWDEKKVFLDALQTIQNL